MQFSTHAYVTAGEAAPTGRFGGVANDIPILQFDTEGIHLTALGDELAPWLREFAANLLTMADEVDARRQAAA